jgi:hypothetical protein
MYSVTVAKKINPDSLDLNKKIVKFSEEDDRWIGKLAVKLDVNETFFLKLLNQNKRHIYYG